MSLIESFFFLVKLDATGVKQGAEELKKGSESINKSLTALDKTTNHVGNSFTRMIRSAGGALIALASVASVISGIKAAKDLADGLGKLSEATGINVENLSAWGDAVAKNGGTLEGFQGTVTRLTTSLTAFATKGKSALVPYFQELGIKMVDAKGKARDFFDILPQLADKFQKLNRAESFGLGQKLGLDEGTIRLLQKGRVVVEDIISRQKQLGIITKQDTEIAAKFNDQWADTAHVFRNLFTQANTLILPALTRILKGVEKVIFFLKDHKHFAVAAITVIASALIALLIPAIIATVTAFAPFLLIAAIITGIAAAFALAYDDIINFQEGNKSLIGLILEKWPLVGEIIRGLIQWFKAMWEVTAGLNNFLVELFTNPSQAWENFKSRLVNGINILFELFPRLKSLVGDIGDAFSTMGKIVTSVWDAIIGAIKSAVSAITGAIDTVQAGYQKVKEFFGGSPEIQQNINTAQGALAYAGSQPLNSQTSNAINSSSRSSSRSTSVQVGDINIQTQATDANGIAGSVSNALETQMRQTINNYDDGVAA